MVDFTRAEICIHACAEAFKTNTAVMASPMGLIPTLGARLAKQRYSPHLMITDGEARIIHESVALEDTPSTTTVGWMPFRRVFDTLWGGRRHVMMGASQIDRYGNQNISCIGSWEKPKAQLLGVRGAPGNTINHSTSYFIPNHSPRVFVQQVDVVSGVGYDRAKDLGYCARFHHLHRVITNLGVFDFESENNRMRLRSIHPGVQLSHILENTGFQLIVDNPVEKTPLPDMESINFMRKVLDPTQKAIKQIED